MNKNVKISIIIFLILVAITASSVTVKRGITAVEKLKLSNVSFEFPKNLRDVLSLMTDSFYSTVTVTISNHSDVNYTVNSIYINVYTLQNNLIAEQTQPLANAVNIPPRKNTEISINYKMDYTTITRLYKDNNLKFSTQTLRNLLLYQKLNTQLILKGTVSTEGITLPINETIDI